MVITIKEGDFRFGCRVGSIIYNEEKTKILLENQNDKMYMFPGGRIDVHDDSMMAINRELKEELNLELDLKLKYIIEMFLKSPSTKYHEIGFYFVGKMKESTIPDNFKSLDGSGKFVWVPVTELNNYKILATPIKDKVINNEIHDFNLEHLVYREY